jgi:hemerythrin-like domain-containing protein
MGKATNDLRKEHEVILHALDLLDQALQSNTKDDQLKLQFGNELVNFLKTFADKCHHGKEENHLFTALVDKGFPSDSGPIGVMLQEHKQGREYIALMKKSLDSNDLPGFSANAALYRDLLRNHIAKENNILLCWQTKLWRMTFRIRYTKNLWITKKPYLDMESMKNFIQHFKNGKRNQGKITKG